MSKIKKYLDKRPELYDFVKKQVEKQAKQEVFDNILLNLLKRQKFAITNNYDFVVEELEEIIREIELKKKHLGDE